MNLRQQRGDLRRTGRPARALDMRVKQPVKTKSLPRTEDLRRKASCVKRLQRGLLSPWIIGKERVSAFVVVNFQNCRATSKDAV